MVSKAFFAFVFVSLSFTAPLSQAGPTVPIVDNFISLPLSLRSNLNGTGSGLRLVQHGRTRARQLVSLALDKQNGKRSHPVTLTDEVVTYVAQVSMTGRLKRLYC